MTKYMVEIEIVDKEELPPDAQDVELLPFLAEHLYDFTKHHDGTKWVIITNNVYKVRDWIDAEYVKAILNS